MVEKGRETHAYCSLFFSTGHTPAFSDPFQRGKARSVARGGWRSECRDGGVVWWSSVVEGCLVQNNQSEKKNDYLNIAARLITRIPSIQQDWANYT